jgi:hypothetical protein
MSYDVNPLFMVALAGAESQFGRNTNSSWGMFNPFGNGTARGAKSWSDAISITTEMIDRLYLDASWASGPGFGNARDLYRRYEAESVWERGYKNLSTFMAELGASETQLRYPCPRGEEFVPFWD